MANGTALAAPSSAIQEHQLSIVIFVVALLSMIGAGFVILSFTFLKELRSFRHFLILGLALSDFIMAFNFALSSGANLIGKGIGASEQKSFCTANGFITQVFVISTDYWVLTVAVATYVILGNFRRASEWMHNHKLVLWVLPWFLASIWATIGLLTAGYGSIGAWCWFTSDFIRIVVNFIPRWIIILSIAAIYGRLYLILRKAHKWDLETAAGRNSNQQDTSILMSPSEDIPMQIPKASYSGSGKGSVSIDMKDVSTASSDAIQRSFGGSHGHGQNQPMNALQLKRIAMKMAIYPLAYCIIWTIPTSIRIYQAAKGESAPFWVGVIDKSCIVIQGLVDALVYGANERAWHGWRNLFASASISVMDKVHSICSKNKH